MSDQTREAEWACCQQLNFRIHRLISCLLFALFSISSLACVDHGRGYCLNAFTQRQIYAG